MRKINITKKEAIKYITLFFLFMIVSMISLAVDNLFWISASPEWDTNFVVNNIIGTWQGAVQNYSFLAKIEYVIGYRIISVFTNWRDYLASFLISSFITGLVIFSNEMIGKRVFSRSFVE